MEYDKQVKNRVKRIEGQLRGILKMMEDNKDCRDVVTQLSATRSAIDRTIGVIVSSNLVECVREANESGGKNPEELVKEAVNLLVKSR
ncbi:metal-sensitive transcriptional regulator [Peribacillus sp. NPDC096448]|uniref:metal-sensitive transcriptional regulator n=1 Tax=Peribacillus sp. NPDC096448 TaxID=3364395 RepID=UPI003811BB18